MKSRGFWVPLGTAQTPDHHFFGTRRGARGRATCARVGRPAPRTDRGEGRRGQFDPWTHRIRTGRASRPRHDPHSAHLGAVRTSSSAEEISATTQRTEASPAAAELRRPFLSSSDALRGCAAMSLRAGGSLARRATAQKLGRTDSPPKKLGGILRNWNRICFNRRAGNNRCRFMQMLLARLFGSRLDSVVFGACEWPCVGYLVHY